MLGTAASSSTSRAGIPGRTEAVKSGAVIFLISSSIITSLAICRRLVEQSCNRASRSCISAMRLLSPVAGFVGERRTDDGSKDLVHVGQPLDGVGESLFIDLRVFRSDTVPDRAVGNSSKFEGHGPTPALMFIGGSAAEHPCRVVQNCSAWQSRQAGIV